MSCEHEFSKITPLEPQYLPNVHRVNNSGPSLLQHRVNRTTHQDVLLTLFSIMRNEYRDLEVDILLIA